MTGFLLTVLAYVVLWPLIERFTRWTDTWSVRWRWAYGVTWATLMVLLFPGWRDALEIVGALLIASGVWGLIHQHRDRQRITVMRHPEHGAVIVTKGE